MNETHIVSSFTDDMNELESLLLQMGGLVEEQLKNATLALKKSDRELAKTVLKGDERINDLEAQLNETAIKILALRQPVAVDLRSVVMSLKIARHLERVGDYAKNTARRINTITKASAFTGSVSTLVRMCEMVQSMIKSALDAYSKRDSNLAEEVRHNDEYVDQMHNTLFRELLTYMMEDQQHISGSIHLLLIAKNLERMGDHVADIAKETQYMVTGEWPENQRNKGDNTSKMIIDLVDIEGK